MINLAKGRRLLKAETSLRAPSGTLGCVQNSWEGLEKRKLP